MAHQRKLALIILARMATRFQLCRKPTEQQLSGGVCPTSPLFPFDTIDSTMRAAIPVLLMLSSASANATRFLGSHPMPGPSEGGYRYIEVAHIHRDRQTPEFLYQEVDRQYVFTGDPSPFSYDGRRYVF